MDEYREDNTCYFHPKEVVVGVCALCLNERLLMIAEKQVQLCQQRANDRNDSFTHRNTSITLPKVFALGSFLNRLDIRHQKFNDDYDSDASTSQEDSFISIKFEDNGVASWEKGRDPKVSLDHCDMSWNQGKCKDSQSVKSVVEHGKPCPSLRWRKRIGQLIKLNRWKRSSYKGNACHVGSKLEGVKVRHGWIKTLTKRRTKE